jgi:hypothetical protein
VFNDNENLKKSQEDQLEINEMLLRSIAKKRIQEIMIWKRRSVKGPQIILVMKKKEKTLF